MRNVFLPVVVTSLSVAAAAAQTVRPSATQYPESARGEQVDVYHGTPTKDPYRWLEDLDSPQTAAWVEEQNKFTFGFLERLPQRAAFRERLTQLWNYERVGIPAKEGGRVFFTRNSGLQNQAVFYVQDKVGTEPRVLIDPNTLAKDGTVALTTARVSDDGKLVAYGTAAAGSDWNEFRVRDVDTGRDLPDVIQWVKFSGLGWTKDGKGFFYSRYPAPEAAVGSGKTFGKLEYQRVYYHRLGTAQSEDRMIFENKGEPKWFARGGTTEDGRYLYIYIDRGSSSENLVSIVDLGDPLAPKIDAPVRPLVAEWTGRNTVVGSDPGVIYLMTTMGAPRYRVVAIDVKDPAPGKWRTIVPESQEVIDSVDVVGGRFVVNTMRDASNRLTVYAKDGKKVGEIPLPGLGSVAAVSGKPDDPEFFYSFVSFATPTTNYRYNLETKRGESFQPPRVAFNPAAFETKQVFYTSKDGTKVPMFITHKKGLKPDRNTPAILYGYGGFNISLTPAFSVTNLAWMEAGGIYAQPNLRGGGEYGKDWHLAGTKERKQNVFDDFIAAGEWLIANQHTSSEKLVLAGGSNGGLLVAAVINQRPDLARVAWPAVGVMDMLRFHKHTVGYAWVSDYGSSDDADGFEYLSKYSPIHNVKSGAKYPAVLITTADHDDRVHPGHSFKYAAAMQAVEPRDAKTIAERPVMIRVETRAGHGAGKPTSKQIEEAADKLAFAAHFVGMSGTSALGATK